MHYMCGILFIGMAMMGIWNVFCRELFINYFKTWQYAKVIKQRSKKVNS